MINQRYRLIAPRQIRVDFVEESISDEQVVVRPKYLSICAADQRYYTGKRSKEILDKKLPMSLIHEAVGEILYDPTNTYKVGQTVVIIPNTPTEKDDYIKENYLRSSKFRASGFDGFLQSCVVTDKTRVISFNDIELRIASLLELISVSMNAIETFENHNITKKDRIGIWGNGSLGFVTALALKYTYPNSKIIVFGKSVEKNNYFVFADETYTIDDIPSNINIDQAFECVGERGSESAIDQIIDTINPQGTILLLGVSEDKILVNTRMILEKGLALLGNSRSGYEDFEAAIKLLNNNPDTINYLNTIISEEIVVKNIDDIHRAFNNDLNNKFKTIMKWEI